MDSVTGDTDGLTTNGIALLRPVGVFESGVEPDTWKEVTVMGNIRETRVQRSSRQPNTAVSHCLLYVTTDSFKATIHDARLLRGCGSLATYYLATTCCMMRHVWWAFGGGGGEPIYCAVPMLQCITNVHVLVRQTCPMSPTIILCHMLTPYVQLPGETNMLTDGCLIDLCGVTLMWRTAMGLDHGPVRPSRAPVIISYDCSISLIRC